MNSLRAALGTERRMGKGKIKLHLLSVTTIACIQKNTLKFCQNIFIFNKIKILFFNSSKFPWRKDTLGTNFGIVKICFPSKNNVEKNIKFSLFLKITLE